MLGLWFNLGLILAQLWITKNWLKLGLNLAQQQLRTSFSNFTLMKSFLSLDKAMALLVPKF
jgi:hypothetical protein